MSAAKAMQEWCRLQCQNYPGVEIRDFSTSFRDGMAFCALIHRHRPDLLDFDSLSKDNVYDNNQLAFEVAEQQLGIPALLDPTDMVTMKVPDRLSIMTYLSQYYNYFRNPPPAGLPHPLAVKRSAALSSSEPALKKTTESESMPQSKEESCEPTRQTFLKSTCASCHQHVHLVQRYLVEGRLYHRHCFRCKECCSTLLPGSYRPALESGTYVCTHHRNVGIGISQSIPDNLKDDGVILRKENLDKDQKGRKDDSLDAVGDASVSVVSLPAAINETYAPSARPSVANRSEEKDTSNLEAEYGAPADPVSEHPLVMQSPHEQTGVANLRPKIQLKPTIPCKPTSLQDQKCALSQVNNPSELQISITVQEQIGNSPNIDHRQSISPVTIQDHISSHSQKDDPVDGLVPSNIVNRTAAYSVSCGPTEVYTVKIPLAPTDTQASVNNELQMPDTEFRKGELENRPIPAARRATGTVVSQLPPPVPRPRTSLPGDRENEAGPLAVTQVTNGTQLEELTPPVPKPRVRPKSSERMVNGRPHKEPPWIALVQMEKKRKAAPPPPGTPLGATAEDQHSSPSPDREGRPTSRKSLHPKPYNPFEDDEEEASGSLLAPGHPWYGITPTSSPKARKRAAPKAPGASPIARHTSLLSTSRVSHSEPSSCTPSPALSIESLSSDLPLNETVSKSSSEPTVHAATLGTANATPAPASVSANELSNHGTGSPASPSSSRSSSCGSLRSSPHRPPPKPPAPIATIASAGEQNTSAPSPPPKTPPKSSCKENPFNRKASPAASPVISAVRKSTKGPKPARPPAPGHGFPLVKRKVQADEYIPEEDIHGELNSIERQLDEMELRGIELEGKLRSVDSEAVDDDELLVDWFRLIHEKHMLVRRESELVYVIKQQNLEQRQADVEYELRCLLNKPEKDWTEDDRDREQVLMKEIVIIIEQRNAIVTCLDEDRQREEEEDKLLAAMIKKKDFLKDPEASMTKKKGKFKPLKVLKRLSSKSDPKTKSPSDKS